MKSGSGNWRLSEKVGKESGEAGAAGGCWSDAHANTGYELGKSGKETATDDSIFLQEPSTGRLTGRRDYLSL